MASKELLGMLNKAIAAEMQVSIQYMWQHVLWRGPKFFAVSEEFKKIAVEEMKHAEEIAERLFYLGEIPTTKPSTITLGNSLKEMAELDMKAEAETIPFYKEIIKKALQENDETTAFLFREILQDEERHHDTFQSLLEVDNSL
jgi:bacterioferritin